VEFLDYQKALLRLLGQVSGQDDQRHSEHKREDLERNAAPLGR
jgi:hypothetical protein